MSFLAYFNGYIVAYVYAESVFKDNFNFCAVIAYFAQLTFVTLPTPFETDCGKIILCGGDNSAFYHTLPCLRSSRDTCLDSPSFIFFTVAMPWSSSSSPMIAT